MLTFGCGNPTASLADRGESLALTAEPHMYALSQFVAPVSLKLLHMQKFDWNT